MDPEFWNLRFSGDDYAYGTEPNAFIADQAHRVPPGRVLCLAEGEGRNAVHLAILGYQVTAVDFSRAGLAKAERLARTSNVELDLVEADLSAYSMEEGAYSGIVSVFAHLPLPLRRRIHADVSRALCEGGVFLLEAYSPRQIELGTGGPKDASLLMALSDLERELADLELEVAREVERDVREGSFHHGRGATVQIVGRRR